MLRTGAPGGRFGVLTLAPYLPSLGIVIVQAGLSPRKPAGLRHAFATIIWCFTASACHWRTKSSSRSSSLLFQQDWVACAGGVEGRLGLKKDPPAVGVWFTLRRTLLIKK